MLNVGRFGRIEDRSRRIHARDRGHLALWLEFVVADLFEFDVLIPWRQQLIVVGAVFATAPVFSSLTMTVVIVPLIAVPVLGVVVDVVVLVRGPRVGLIVIAVLVVPGLLPSTGIAVVRVAVPVALVCHHGSAKG